VSLQPLGIVEDKPNWVFNVCDQPFLALITSFILAYLSNLSLLHAVVVMRRKEDAIVPKNMLRLVAILILMVLYL
jgi:hypothetical protein